MPMTTTPRAKRDGDDDGVPAWSIIALDAHGARYALQPLFSSSFLFSPLSLSSLFFLFSIELWESPVWELGSWRSGKGEWATGSVGARMVKGSVHLWKIRFIYFEWGILKVEEGSERVLRFKLGWGPDT